ncbi:MAG: sulfite exporter TauE/SafE family protein, partial [Calditrichaeota bacterium]|nr:sulfite exporter TauE/SafE family protein [Calditrichota bacterium]
LSGFLAGVLGTGGAIRGLTLSAFNLEKQVFIATSAVIDLCIDLSRSVVYFFNGFIHQHDLYLLPFLLIASIAGTLIGKQILKQLNQDQFRKLVLYLILGIGMVTLFSVI